MRSGPTFSLDALFKPRSVAIVGISPNQNRATLAYQNMKQMGYTGEIYFVNAKYDELYGKKCYPSISAIPAPIDAVYVSIPGEHVLPALREAADKGAKGAVVISSGFGEGEGVGKDKSAELVRFARQHQFAVCGPNCLGLISCANNFSSYGFFFPEGLKKGRVGGIFQSGGLMHAIAGELGRRGVGLSTIVSSGNEMVVNSSHYLEYLANDPGTDVIMAFLEGIKDPERFKRAADLAYQKKKPVVLVKVGRSENAAKAAIAHTGSMTGSDKVIDTLFKQKGIIRANDVDELIETVVLFSIGKLPTGSGVAITTTSGGEAGMYADLGENLGIYFPPFQAETNRRLKQVLPEFGSLGNPLDTTGNAALDKDLYSSCLFALAEDPNVHVIAVSQMDITESALTNNKTTQVVVESIQECSRRYDKPVLLFTPNAGGADDKVGEALLSKGIPLLVGAYPSFKAIRNLIWYASVLEKQPPTAAPVVSEVKRTEVFANRGGVLTERESQQIFQQYGIPVPQKVLVHSSREAVEAANSIGYPVVLKVESADIPHKSDAGGVKLNLTVPLEVEQAYEEILRSVKAHHPQAAISGITVEEMVAGGVETIVGVKVDPLFGPVVMVGSGGVLVELLQDVSLRLAPLQRNDAVQMIKETKLATLLSGYRGKPEADMDALAEVLVNLSQLGYEHQDVLQEIEINPLLVLPKGAGCRAVDGLIVLKSSESQKVAHS